MNDHTVVVSLPEPHTPALIAEALRVLARGVEDLPVRKYSNLSFHIIEQCHPRKTPSGVLPAGLYLEFTFARPRVSEEIPPIPDAEMLRMMLTLIDIDMPLATIENYTEAQRSEVAGYVSAVHRKAGDHDDVEVPPVPEVLRAWRSS